MQEFDFVVKYQKGRNDAHVDIFTRQSNMSKHDKRIDDRTDLIARVDAIERITLEKHSEILFPGIEDFEEEQTNEDISNLGLIKEGRSWVNSKNRVYVLNTLRRPLMYYFHFSRSGGHQGVSRSYKRMGVTFWWPRMKEDIQHYNAECITCNRVRSKPNSAPVGNLFLCKVDSSVGLSKLFTHG